MAVQYATLFALETQFQAKDGRNNTGGWLKVFLAGTDDPAVTFSDYNGTRNPEKIVLDDDGRAVVICDKSKGYRLEVYDISGMLLWTEEPVFCSGTGGGGISVTRVISTDGSISVDESVVGSTTTYDIGLAPSDSDEFLEWAKCVDEDVANGNTFPSFVDGTMETAAGKGLHVGKDKFYHITASFRVYPKGDGINYDSLETNLMFDDGGLVPSMLIRRTYDIDSSLHDSVMCEFSYDFKAPSDGYLYFKLDGVNAFHDVAIVMQVHRIYSGINAVPDTCATKEWVQETFDYNLSSKVDYSAIEYNQGGDITGISGSAIAASHVDPTVFVPWSASGAFAPSGDYAYNSSLSGYIPASASGMFQPSGNYQSAGDYAFNSAVSSKLDASASGSFVLNSSFSSFSSNVESAITAINSSIVDIVNNVSSISGNMSSYVPFSGLEGDGMKITGISGSAIKGHEYTGINPVVVDNVNDTIAVEHRTLCVDSTMTAYNSGNSAVIGVNVGALDLSSKMDASASSEFYSTSNPSGFITGIDLTPYQKTADMTAYQLSGDYAFNSSLSSKMDASASSEFYSTSNPSGFITGVDLSEYAKQSALELKADASALSSYQPTSAMSAYATESWASAEISAKLDVTATSQFITALPADMATTADVVSAVSGKLDKSASGEFYPMSGNPSGFLTAHQSLAGLATESYVDSAVSGKLDSTAYNSAQFQLTADMSAYQLSGDYAYNSSLSSKMDASASSDFYSTSNPSGFITGVDLDGYATTGYVDSAVSGKLDASASGSFQPSGDYYSATNPSGFITGVDLSPYQTTAGMSAYQLTADMTAYQPSGDYIYASALGIAEV